MYWLPRPGVEDRLSSRVRAPAGRHIDRLAYQVGAHVVRHRITDHFLGAAAGDGRQIDESLPGSDTGDIAHPLHSRLAGGEVPLDQVGARAQVRGRDSGADLSAGLCGHQALLTHDGAHRVAVHHHAPAPQGRSDAPVPVGSVRGTELSLDEKCQSASSGGGRRLRPAAPAVVAGLRYSGPLAHQRDRVAVLLAVNGLVPCESLLLPREVRCCFF